MQIEESATKKKKKKKKERKEKRWNGLNERQEKQCSEFSSSILHRDKERMEDGQ